MIKTMANLLGQKLRPKQESPLEHLKALHQWLDQLTTIPEYDAHQRVVALLDEFYRQDVNSDLQQVHILGLIEQAGSKLQYGLISRFFSNQQKNKAANAAFLLEITAFYRLLAQIYQHLVKIHVHHNASHSLVPTLVLRALHYHGKLIQWRYLRFELPTAQTWQAVNRLYLIALHHEFANKSMILKGNAYASCEAVYARILLLHLMQPVGLTAHETELAAYWSWKWRDLLHLSSSKNQATHVIDLADNQPPRLNIHAAHNSSVLYWSIRDVLEEVITTTSKTSQAPHTVKLYGVPCTADRRPVLEYLHARLSSRTISSTHDLPADVRVGCDTDNNNVPLHNQALQYFQAQCRITGHPNEAFFQLTITEEMSLCHLNFGHLLLLESAEMTAPVLAVLRWIDKKGRKLTTLGMERLGKAPRQIAFRAVDDVAQPAHTQAIPLYEPQHEPLQETQQEDNRRDGENKPPMRQDIWAVSEPNLILGKNIRLGRYLDIMDSAFADKAAIYRIRTYVHPTEFDKRWSLVPFSLLTCTPIQTQTTPQSQT